MENISPKEWLISIAVVVMAFAVAIFVNPFITDRMYDRLGKMRVALQVDSDSQMFQYAHKTNVGNVLSYGQFVANDPVSIPELSGSYGLIERVTERYTQHQRTVCDARDEDGNCTSSHTEIYYTWDTYKHTTMISQSFSFLGEQFPSGILNLSWKEQVQLDQSTVSSQYIGWLHGSYLYNNGDWWANEGDLRFYYHDLPLEFSGTMFVRFFDNRVVNPVSPKLRIDIYYEQSIDSAIAGYEQSIKIFNILYYAITVIVVVSIYFYWAYSIADVE